MDQRSTDPIHLWEPHDLDPDHDRRSVGSDLGLNGLQRSSADEKSRQLKS